MLGCFANQDEARRFEASVKRQQALDSAIREVFEGTDDLTRWSPYQIFYLYGDSIRRVFRRIMACESVPPAD